MRGGHGGHSVWPHISPWLHIRVWPQLPPMPRGTLTSLSPPTARCRPSCFNLFSPRRRARSAAGLGRWQIVSAGHGAASGRDAAGSLLKLPSLEGIQGRRFEAPQVIFADALTGNEDIPFNVSAVLTPSSVDMLAHVAIRARNQARGRAGSAGRRINTGRPTD